MTEATISRARRIPAIWLVPIVALLLGIWMVIYAFTSEGPEITVVFSTAQGIEAGKTKLKARSVEVGIVELVTLNEDLESVSVVASLEREATALLRDGTRFWVVRPRIGATGISGLATVMSGAYIELEPGSGAPSDRRDFVGLDDLPVTAVDTPGLRLVLVSKRAGSVGVGNPVLYHGYAVGRVEGSVLDPGAEQVRYSVFIEAPYDRLVNEATRFWNASGISVRASAEGMRLDVGSLQTLLAGGVAFDVPEGRTPLGPVENGVEFALYDNYESTTEGTYEYSQEYVVSFAQSVRGLLPGAPVEYRGVRVGSVRRILLDELAQVSSSGGERNPIPVLISLQPGRLMLGDTAEAVSRLKGVIERGVAAGAWASLESGNLLTGSLYISMDYHPEEGVGEMGTFAGYPTLPTVSGGFQRIERQVSQLLAKLNDLPLDATVHQLNGMLVDLRLVIGSDDFQQLPGSLTAALDELKTGLETISPDSPPYNRLTRTVTELNRTLQTAERTLRTVGEQPNSLIFSRPIEPDPIPRGQP